MFVTIWTNIFSHTDMLISDISCVLFRQEKLIVRKGTLDNATNLVCYTRRNYLLVACALFSVMMGLRIILEKLFHISDNLNAKSNFAGLLILFGNRTRFIKLLLSIELYHVYHDILKNIMSTTTNFQRNQIYFFLNSIYHFWSSFCLKNFKV